MTGLPRLHSGAGYIARGQSAPESESWQTGEAVPQPSTFAVAVAAAQPSRPKTSPYALKARLSASKLELGSTGGEVAPGVMELPRRSGEVGGRPVQAEEAALGEQTGADEGHEAAAAEPTADITAVRASLANLQAKLTAADARRVDPALAADLVNTIRRTRLRQQRLVSFDQVIARILPDQEVNWYRAQGIDPGHDVGAIRSNAFLSGLANPHGTLLMIAANYVGGTAVTAATGKAWAGALTSGVVALATPVLNAVQQSFFVTLSEHVRATRGFTISKGAVKDQNWLPDLAHQLAAKAEMLLQQGSVFGSVVDRLTDRHLPEIDRSDPANATWPQNLMACITPGERDELAVAHTQFHAAEATVGQTHINLWAAEASLTRQWKANRFQVLPRSLRPPGSSLPSLGAGLKEPAPLQIGQRREQFSDWTGFGIQTAIAALLYGVQTIAAAFDETYKQDYHNLLNLVFGDYISEAGEAKLRSGQSIGAEDISEDKLRSFIRAPEQNLKEQIERIVAAVRQKYEEQAKAVRRSARVGDGEGLEGGTPLSPRDHERLIDLEGRVAALTDERARLAAGDIAGLPPEGLAARLVHAASQSFNPTVFLRKQALLYAKPGELNSQIAQRVGQSFHMGVAGSAVSSVVGRVTNAVRGGTAQATTRQILALAGVGLLLAGIGAWYQGAAVAFKNNRRENEAGGNKVSFYRQVGRGMIAAPIVIGGKASAARSRSRVTEALNEMQVILRADALLTPLLQQPGTANPGTASALVPEPTSAPGFEPKPGPTGSA